MSSIPIDIDMRLDTMVVSASHSSLAARPAYEDEHGWETFRRVVRAGQVWQTNRSIIRVDNLIENRQTRRSASRLRFMGAWSAASPKGLRSLLPQRDGRFLYTSGPWTVSRMYEPFLLLKSDVRDTPAEEADSQPLALEPVATPTPELGQNPDNNRDTVSGLAFDASQPMSERRTADIASAGPEAAAAKAVSDLRDYFTNRRHMHAGRPAFDIKVQRLNIPDAVRAVLDEDTIQEVANMIATAYIDGFILDVQAVYPWISDIYQEGRSGGWLEFKVNGYDIPASSTAQAINYEGNSVENTLYTDVVIGIVRYSAQYVDDLVSDIVSEISSVENTAPDSLPSLQHTVKQMIAESATYILRAFQDIESRVQAMLEQYSAALESEEFWSQWTTPTQEA